MKFQTVATLERGVPSPSENTNWNSPAIFDVLDKLYSRMPRCSSPSLLSFDFCREIFLPSTRWRITWIFTNGFFFFSYQENWISRFSTRWRILFFFLRIFSFLIFSLKKRVEWMKLNGFLKVLRYCLLRIIFSFDFDVE